MSLWRPVLNASVWLVAGRSFSLLATFISIVAISRTLGPAEFGQLSYVLAVVAIIAPLGQFGLNAIVVKDLVKAPDDTGGILGSTLAIRVGATAFSLVVAVLAVAYLRPDDVCFRWLVLFLMLAEIVRAWAVCSFPFEARGEFGLIALVNTAIAIGFACLKIFFAVHGAGLDTFVALFAGEAALSGPLYYILYRRRLRRHHFSASFKQIRDLTRRSGYLAISGMLAIANLKVDQIMLGNIAGDSAAGIYAVAARLSEFWFFIPGLLTTALFPMLVDLYDRNQHKFQIVLQRSFDALALVAFAFIAMMSLLALPIVTQIFGQNYEAAALIVIVHMWSGLFFAIRAMASKWLVLKDLYFMSLVSHGLGAGGNIIMNYVLIPEHGPLGAAVATVISYAISGYIVFFFHSATRPIAYRATFAILVVFRLPVLLWRAFSSGDALAPPTDSSRKN